MTHHPQWARAAHAAGQLSDPAAVQQHIAGLITEAGGRVDYIELVDAGHLGKVTNLKDQPTLLAIAAHFPAKDKGTVRLIDNTVLGEDS